MLSAGDPRKTRTYERLRADFLAARPQPCWRCGRAIDYDGPARALTSPTVDHADEVDSHPHLALRIENFRAAHLDCNSRAGAQYRNEKHAEPPPMRPDPGPSRSW